MKSKTRTLGNGSITESITSFPGGILIRIIKLMLTKMGIIREILQITTTSSGTRASREKQSAPFAGDRKMLAELLGEDGTEESAEQAAAAAEKMFRPGSKKELWAYLAAHPDCSLGSIDVSELTDLSELFLCSERRDYSGIELWDTSRVTDMSNMFHLAVHFNYPIGIWDVGRVRNFSKMFMDAQLFNQPLEAWNTSSAISFYCMFASAPNFNQPLEGWDTSSVQNMRAMFHEASHFNQPLNGWDVSRVKDFSAMFYKARAFNQPLNRWNLASAEYLNKMFCGASTFDQDLSAWNTSAVKDHKDMLKGTKRDLAATEEVPVATAAAGSPGSAPEHLSSGSELSGKQDSSKQDLSEHPGIAKKPGAAKAVDKRSDDMGMKRADLHQ